ncbi:MAG: hypothetical protein ACRDHZ_10110 [Ktedonobacteraceae bacterium]
MTTIYGSRRGGERACDGGTAAHDGPESEQGGAYNRDKTWGGLAPGSGGLAAAANEVREVDEVAGFV